jgi:carboxyl-terminal processing protease
VHIGQKYTAFYGRDRFDRLREESLDASLTHQSARSQTIAAGSLYHLDGRSLGQDKDEIQPLVRVRGEAARAKALLRDPEVGIARDLVMWAPSADRSEILANIGDFVGEARAKHEQGITRSFAKAKIDWSPGAAPATGQAAKLHTELVFSAPDGRIKAGKTGTLTLKVTNTGNAPAFRVRAMSDSDYTYFDERELFFGRIDPGKTREATLELSVDKHELSRSDRIAFMLADQHGSELVDKRPSIEIHGVGIDRPRLAYSYQVIDLPQKSKRKGLKGKVSLPPMTPNGDGALQVGERVRLRVRVENLGSGAAQDPMVQLTNESGEAVFLNSARAKVGKLDPGAHKEIDLDFEVRAIPS